jgi:arsenate reductase
MPAASPPAGILFLCIANSIRSQLAEGLARRVAPEGIDIFSAGVAPGRLSPYVVRVLSERGIDASEQYSKPLSAVPYAKVGLVVTLCREDLSASIPAGPRLLSWPLEDPIARAVSEKDVLDNLRRLSTDLERRIAGLFATRSKAGWGETC